MVHGDNDGAWFSRKGFPIIWQGWALVVGYLLALNLLAWIAAVGSGPFKFAATILFAIATGIFTEVSRRRTRDSWKWHLGKSD